MRPALTFIEIEFMTLDLVQQSAHAASDWRPVLSFLSTRQLQEQLLRSQSAGKISERQAPD